MNLDPILDRTQAAEGFDDSEDGEGWERVGKNKGKKGRNGTVLPKPTQSLQRELINATGQEDWFGDNSAVSNGNGNSIPLSGNSSQRVSHQHAVFNRPSHRKVEQTKPAVTHIPPVTNQPTSTYGSRPPPIPDGFNHWLGKFKFRLACLKCFTKNPEKEGFSAYQFYQWHGHVCAKDQILCQIGSKGDGWGLIRARTNPFHDGYFQMCTHFQSESYCKGHRCHFAHSEEEKELWYAERRASFDREQLLTYLRGREDEPGGGQRPTSVPNSNHGNFTPAHHQSPPTGSQKTSNHVTAGTNGIAPFRHRLKKVCSVCAEGGPSNHQRENVNYCSVPDRHDWKQVVYLVLTKSGSWVGVSSRNAMLSPFTKPVMCKYATNCFYQERMGQTCKFTHSDEEMELWQYQASYKLQSVEEVISVQRKGHSGHGVPTPFPPPPPTATPLPPRPPPPPSAEDTQEKQSHQWKHKEPPFVLSGNYRLCRYNLMGTCSYSGLADDYNFCRFAHSEDELREWKERHRMKTQEKSYGYRQTDVKVTETQSPWTAMPRQPDTYPKTPSTQQIPSTTGSLGIPSRGSQVYTPVSRATNQTTQPPLQNTIPNSNTQTASEISVPMLVMPKLGLTPDNVKKLVIRKPPQELGAFKASYSHQWKFLVSTVHLNLLRNVGLLPDFHQRHFRMVHSRTHDGLVCEITFRSTVCGFFQQRLFFDFGSHDNSIILFMTAIIGEDSYTPHNPVPPTEEPLTPQAPWTKPHFTIVPYSTESQLEPFYQKLLDDYPPPPTGKITFQGGEGFHPSCFKTYLHKLIQLEEKTCNEKISKFCCSSELVLSSDLRQEEIYQSAQVGELFGTLKMNKGLTDNSDASQIVTKMAHFILIKFNLSSKVVYQSKIFYDRDNVLQQDDVIFVQIGQKCVQAEKLKAGLKVKVHVQFEINRVNFCSMHYGVDHFNNIELAFPPSGEPRFPKVRRDECVDMNPKQEAAARYIVGAGITLPDHPGPTVISGPFGTGKTHAVAKIVMRLLLQSPSSKILIATHTNSAADWYITEHLHPLLTRLSAVQRGLVLRIYATMVDPKRVNKLIRENYALLDGDGCFREPQLADVGRCRIVIATLSTAIHLVELGELHGRFTHIFIDEAGQALEAEVMIPLGLAGTATVVVLAGDHKQMKPKVYSKECQQRLFQRSMLERLIIWNRNSKCGFVQSLTFNYRMRPEILQFITKFYDGIPLEARGNNQPHPDLYPVSFYAVSGLEKQIGVSYVNALEAETIAILVKTLVESSWPTTEWGEYEASSVAVITPYNSQVKHIRNLLRQKKLGGITVERVQNMQGKQYRVVFISTVHTRNKLLEEVKGGNDQSDSSEEKYRGFLSDEGELITAFTRSQSLLFVVGDPVPLCTMGACRQAWWGYLQECHTHNSLLPEGTTLETVVADIQASVNATAPPSEDTGNARHVNPYQM